MNEDAMFGSQLCSNARSPASRHHYVDSILTPTTFVSITQQLLGNCLWQLMWQHAKTVLCLKKQPMLAAAN
jgi:hypothetical protein